MMIVAETTVGEGTIVDEDQTLTDATTTADVERIVENEIIATNHGRAVFPETTKTRLEMFQTTRTIIDETANQQIEAVTAFQATLFHLAVTHQESALILLLPPDIMFHMIFERVKLKNAQSAEVNRVQIILPVISHIQTINASNTDSGIRINAEHA